MLCEYLGGALRTVKKLYVELGALFTVSGFHFSYVVEGERPQAL